MWPSLFAAATRYLPLCEKTTGDVVNGELPVEKESFFARVFPSSATISPSPVETKTVPSVPKAVPITSPPPGVFQDFADLSGPVRSIIQTAFGTPPHLPLVDA